MKFMRFFFDEKPYQIKGPDIRFGRYSDAVKSKEQYVAWENALKAFEQGDYLQTYMLFFDYLKDPKEDSVHCEKNGNFVQFILRQGSALIEGKGDQNKLEAKVRIAQAADFSVALLRELLESNYALQYSRYALDGDEIVLYFETFAVDTYPYKLYQGLKELAVKADKLDDLIAWDYENLHLINQDLRIPVPSAQQKIKHHFLENRIEQVLNFYDQNPYMVNHNAGAISYQLLSCCYKLDYLTKPEGLITEEFERVHKLFFSESKMDLVSKNKEIYKALDGLLRKNPLRMQEEFYKVWSTFGIVQPVGQNKIKNLIASESTNMQWYIDNDMEPMVIAMTEYIVGYALFNYAVPPPIRELFHFFYMVQEQAFFNELGFQFTFKEEQVFKTREIRKHLKGIKNRHRLKYPKFNPSVSYLDFGTNITFCKSFLELVFEMDLTLENEQYGLDEDN